MDPILLQKQVRDNSEDLQNYLKDLKGWESEMKRKERELCNDSRSRTELSTTDVPPLRNKLRKTKKKEDDTSSKNDNSKRIAGLDYASWDKFDVDKACEDVDEGSEESNDETESEEEDAEIGRIRDEAMYEKEKGNQFVKNQKWMNAIECYTRAIECYPYDAIFFANRALCYLKTSDFKAAEADCTSALHLDISYVKAFHRRAAARTGLGLLEEAKSDLEKVLMLEPKNTATKSEILKIEKKINAQKAEKGVSCEKVNKESAGDKLEPSQSTSLMKDRSNSVQSDGDKLEPSQSTSSSLTKDRSNTAPPRQSAVTTSNSKKEETVSDDTLQLSKAQIAHAISESKGVIVHPIHKPPHLRSKKPLKEMKIKVINEGMPKKAVDLSDFQSHANIVELQEMVSQERDMIEGKIQKPPADPGTTSQEGRVEEKIARETSNNSRVTKLANEQKTKPETSDNEPDDISNIPPPARTYIDFFVAWNKVHQSTQRRFLYLKQIPGADLPKIFGESLDSTILSGLIETLETSFLPSKEPVFPYLDGLSKVKRLSTITLFMSNADKTRLETLLDSCELSGECTKEEGIGLRKKYEL